MPTISTPSRRASRSSARCRNDVPWLEQLRAEYHHRRFVHPDPLEFLYRYDDLRDREVAGFIASSLAYGNVTAMLPAIAGVLDRLGPAPAETIRTRSARTVRTWFRTFRYRFTTGAQLAGLIEGIRRIQERAGSLDAALAGWSPADGESVLPALGTLVDELERGAPCSLSHLVPHPNGGSACKRLNLYARWMVRCDEIDPGGWTSVTPAQLVMPLDTHVHRTALDRGWTHRRSADLRTAIEVTAALRAIAPDDPLRYDFAITRPGIRRERGSRPDG